MGIFARSGYEPTHAYRPREVMYAGYVPPGQHKYQGLEGEEPPTPSTVEDPGQHAYRPLTFAETLTGRSQQFNYGRQTPQ
jgi:hypothetical protein